MTLRVILLGWILYWATGPIAFGDSDAEGSSESDSASAASPSAGRAFSRSIQMHSSLGAPSAPAERWDEDNGFSRNARRMEWSDFEASRSRPVTPYIPPRQPSRSAEEDESSGNWLTPRSNLDRIEGLGEQREADPEEDSDSSDTLSWGWLADDVRQQREDRAEEEEQQAEEGEEEDADIRLSLNDEETEANNGFERADPYSPTSNYVSDQEPSEASDSAPLFGSFQAAGAGAPPEQSLRDTGSQQWTQQDSGRFAAAEETRYELDVSRARQSGSGFGGEQRARGELDRLNQSVRQQLQRDGFLGNPNLSASVRGTASSGASGEYGSTSDRRSSPSFFEPSASFSAFGSDADTAGGVESSGYSGWKPAGPQNPMEAFQPLDTGFGESR